MMYCDICGSHMLDLTTSTAKTYGGQKHYVCGGYMRKGRGYCEYIGWRKETIEQVVAIKLRNTFLCLTMGQNLRDEITLYYADRNKHTIVETHTIESEISYLRNRVDADGENPQWLNQMLDNYLSKVLIQRESKHSFITIQINLSDETVYEKTIVANRNFTISYAFLKLLLEAVLRILVAASTIKKPSLIEKEGL